MRVKVLLFGQLKDIVGRQEESLDLESGARLSAVMSHYSGRYPRFQGLNSSIACSINQEYAQASAILKEGDEVGLLPPVSGGKSKVEELRSEHCTIVREPINLREIRKNLDHPEDGAAPSLPAIAPGRHLPPASGPLSPTDLVPRGVQGTACPRTSCASGTRRARRTRSGPQAKACGPDRSIGGGSRFASAGYGPDRLPTAVSRPPVRR